MRRRASRVLQTERVRQRAPQTANRRGVSSRRADAHRPKRAARMRACHALGGVQKTVEVLVSQQRFRTRRGEPLHRVNGGGASQTRQPLRVDRAGQRQPPVRAARRERELAPAQNARQLRRREALQPFHKLDFVQPRRLRARRLGRIAPRRPPSASPSILSSTHSREISAKRAPSAKGRGASSYSFAA